MGGRRGWLVERLGGRLAHLLNRGCDVLSLCPEAIDRAILSELSRPDYAEGLVGARLAGLADCPERAGERYFAEVLDAPRHLKGNSQLHKAHELFLALCRRGRDPAWRWAMLERHNPAPDAPGSGPEDFVVVRERLAALDHAVTPGNPAARTRESAGPLYAVAGGAACEVPEQMSVRGALASGPPRIVKLTDRQDFNRFCSVLIKALETAHERHGRLLSLGLSPFDWPDISTNKAKAALTFLNKVREVMDDEHVAAHDIDTWRQVWPSATVPGFADADAFWASAFGSALRQSGVLKAIPFEAYAEVLAGAEEPDLLAPEDYAAGIDAAAARGLAAFDVWLLHQVNAGRTLMELRDAPETARQFGRRLTDDEFRDYIEDLMERCRRLSNQNTDEEEA
jgi:hypothetical protein